MLLTADSTVSFRVRARPGPAGFLRILALAGLILQAAVVHANESTMDAEIDYLLQSVGASNCVFIRNGSEYEAAAAKEHLQMKRRKGRRYYGNAEEFIERIASRSSWSGKEYRIRCDGEEQTAKAWFMARLDRFRESGGS
jgi:hypothetical protein